MFCWVRSSYDLPSFFCRTFSAHWHTCSKRHTRSCTLSVCVPPCTHITYTYNMPTHTYNLYIQYAHTHTYNLYIQYAHTHIHTHKHTHRAIYIQYPHTWLYKVRSSPSRYQLTVCKQKLAQEVEMHGGEPGYIHIYTHQQAGQCTHTATAIHVPLHTPSVSEPGWPIWSIVRHPPSHHPTHTPPAGRTPIYVHCR